MTLHRASSLTHPVAPAADRRSADWWAVDKVMLSYFAAAVLVEFACWWRLPRPGELLAAHVAGASLIALAALYPKNRVWLWIHHWYPLPYVFFCYKEMSLLIPALGRPAVDLALAQLDLRVWGAHPTVWLERITTPLLTEALQIIYSLFVPAVLFVPVLLWLGKRYREFRYYAFLIACGFLISYVGYLVAPARGPRFALRDQQHFELQGLWLYGWLRTTLDHIESAHYDCFPSGHTELTILASWGSRAISSRLFRAMLVYTLGVVFATVYLRYHYTVDVLAGAFVAGALIWIIPKVYAILDPRGGE